MRRANLFQDIRQDVSYALRALRLHAGFTVVTLLVLALGIGANTAMFTLVNALMLRTLPVPAPNQLITIGDPTATNSTYRGNPRLDMASYPVYADVRDGAHSVAEILAAAWAPRLDAVIDRGKGNQSVNGEAEHPAGRLVSGNYFSVLGVHAALGRMFTADEDKTPGADPIVVISQSYWRQRFAGDSTVIGRTIALNGTPLTIVGVAPAGFTGDVVEHPTDIWIPLMMQPSLVFNLFPAATPQHGWIDDRTTSWLLLMGRLAPGVSAAQAGAVITGLERRSIIDHPLPDNQRPTDRELQQSVRIEAGGRGFSAYRSIYAESLVTLMVAVVLVLLVVCANVANLMLARTTARGRELSLRMALGAHRARLIRQLLTESVILAGLGGAFGLLIAFWGTRALLHLAGTNGPVPLDTHLDGRVLAFTGLVSLATAMIFGLFPAVRATRVDLATSLRAGGRTVAGTTGRFPVGKILVLGQIALSLLLLVGTGMLVRSMARLEHSDVGVRRDQLVMAMTDAQRAGYSGARLAALLSDMSQRVARVPGVAAVSYSENGIFSGRAQQIALQVEGFTAYTRDDSLAYVDRVGPNYFQAIGAHLLSGRDITLSDDASAAKIAVVNESFARHYFAGGNAIGRRIEGLGGGSFEIVGVVADIQDRGLRQPPIRRAYYAVLQADEIPAQLIFEIRASGDPAALLVPVRAALLAADPALAITRIDPLTSLIGRTITQDRLVTQVLTFFGVLALVLAALGLYGVMAYTTLRRTSEFGIRMALGAQSAHVLRMVLGEVALVMAGGVIVGLPLALAGTRLLKHQLFEVQLVDLPSIVAAIVVLTASGIAAGLLPAIRAARVGPLRALRAE